MSDQNTIQNEVEEFKTEGIELLEAAEKSLLDLDANSCEFGAAYDEIFRAFHSLKGAAGMLELVDLQAFTHGLENELVGIKTRNHFTKEEITRFLGGIDVARKLLLGEEVEVPAHNEEAAAAPEVKIEVGQSKNEDTKLPDSVVEEFFSEANEIIQRISDELQLIETVGATRESVDSLYRDIHTLKGTSYLFSFNLVGDLSHAMESGLEKVREGTHQSSVVLINLLFKSLTILETLLRKLKSKSSTEDFKQVVSLLSQGLAKASEKLEPIHHSYDDVTPPSGPKNAETIPELVSQLESEVEEVSQPVVQKKDVATTAAAPQDRDSENLGTIRVSVSLLDNLMTLMGEMVLVRNQVLQYSNRVEDLELMSMSKRLNVVTGEIQGEMMKTRMQPIGNVLGKFNRVVRDLSRELSKEINLTVHGAETELDKTLLEAIKDPLTHIVRNSCDHGIEVPEVRKKSGKSSTGNVQIKAYHEGGQVVIEVSDDGKGLHKEALVNKALEKGLIKKHEAEKLSDKEIFELIFHPGFSTAAKITNVSGRGVGMDVVRTNIEKIGGTVDLSSVAGKGTSIKLKVPLTLAIIPALLVRCGEGTFAIPQVKLEELVRVDQTSPDNRIEYILGAPVYRLRGNILPLVEMNSILSPSKPQSTSSIVNIAVLNAENFSFGVIVDEVYDTADIVVKPLNRLLKSLQIYSGGTILGDGTVALIFDVSGVAKYARVTREHSDAKSNDELQHSAAELQDFLMVRVRAEARHAIALSYVQRLEVFPLKSVEVSGGQRVIRYRDSILPLVSANQHLGYPAGTPIGDSISVVVVGRAGAYFGIEVDEILDTLSTSAELHDTFIRNSAIFGNLNLESDLVVVINPFELIAREFPDPTEDKVQGPVLTEVSGQGLKILLAEDTAFFRKAIKKILDEAGFTVVVAQDGMEAVEILNSGKHKFDMIVSDIEMPRLNGFELARAVKGNPSFSHIPMLAISSRADKQYRAEGLKSGFDTYLEKLKPPILLAAIKELTKKVGKVA